MISIQKSQDACMSCGARPAIEVEVGRSPCHTMALRLCAACFQQAVDLATGIVDFSKIQKPAKEPER